MIFERKNDERENLFAEKLFIYSNWNNVHFQEFKRTSTQFKSLQIPMEDPPMENPDLPVVKKENHGTLLDKSDNLSYYSSYSDSFFSENAIPIEPKEPPKNSVRRNFSRMPEAPSDRRQGSNPRIHKYKIKPKKESQETSSLSKSQLDTIMKNALQRKNISITLSEDFQAVRRHITQRRDLCVKNHRYEKANQFQKALEYVSQCESRNKNNEMYKTKSQDLSQKETAFKSSLESFDNDTKTQYDSLLQEIETQRTKLHEKHQNEIQSFEERWNGQAKLKLYSQPSHTLSNLRRQLNFMLTQCRYEDAKEVQKQIDERAKYEQDENALQMKIDFNEALKKLSTRHAEEKRFFEESSQLKITNFEQRRKQTRLGFENREKKLILQRENANPDNVRKRKSSQMNVARITKRTTWQKEYEQLPLPKLSSSKSRKVTMRTKSSKQ